MRAIPKEAIFLVHFRIFLAISFVLIIASYFFIDRTLATFSQTFPTQIVNFFKVVQVFGDPLPNLTLWPAAFFFVRIYTKKERAAHRLLQIALSIALANLVSFCLKNLIGRARPELYLPSHEYGFFFMAKNFFYQSFPSGHAVTFSAIFGSLACFFPKRSFLFLAVALFLSFSRVVTGAHFFSDILAGIFIGFSVAQWAYSKDFNKPLL